MEKQLIPHKESIVTPKEQEEFYLRFEVKQVLCVVRNPWGQLLHLVLSLCSLGLFALAFIWNKKLWKSTRFSSAKIEKATHVILVTEHDEEILLPKKVEFDENGNLRIIIVYRIFAAKYIYEHGEFIAQRNALKLNHKAVLAMGDGISQENYDLLRSAFGDNSIEIKVDSIFKVFTEEALSSFNVYQLFACIIWYFRDYVQYAVIILVFVCISIIYEVSLIRGEQRKINQMSDSTLARVYRKGRDGTVYSSVVESRELVPGDVIEISAEEKIPCDLVLIDGSCLIDESLLTGESVPVLKNKLPKTEDEFSDTNKEHILFAGTYCITSRASKDVTQPAKALVYQIGFATTKGRLVRSIMFNDPGVYRFERDSNFFTLGLFLISLMFVGIYYYIAFTKYTEPIETSEVLLRSVDIVLTMVPPGLSLSLSIGVEYAQSRLNKQGIVALKGRLINAAGRMKAIFFDKTGTLTINEMKLDSVYLNVADSNKPQPETPELLDFDEYKRQVKAGERQPSSTAVTQLLKHFAANQGLAYVRNEILGDPMEVELFQFE